MTWLHIPGTASTCALAPMASALASNSPCRERVASLMWRGKPLPPQRWSALWNRETWLRRLSGLTLAPSTLDDGAAAFIASLPAIPASPTASRESEAGPTTTGSLSTRCCAWSMSAGLSVSSAKTCRGMRTDSLPPSSRHWKQWAIALNAEYSARPKPVTAMAAVASSCWPTAPISRGGYTRDKGDPTKEHQAREWATPRTISGGANSQRKARGAGGHDLQEQVQSWPTPSALQFEALDIGRMFQRQARQAAKIGNNGFGLTLANAAQIWATPTARMHKGGGNAVIRKDGKSRLDMLDW